MSTKNRTFFANIKGRSTLVIHVRGGCSPGALSSNAIVAHEADMQKDGRYEEIAGIGFKVQVCKLCKRFYDG